jgi:hypothetical protein
MEWWLLAGVFILTFGFVVFFGAPYVPSRRRYVARAFEHYDVGKRDVVVDLGSGDGLVLRQAALRGARAIGFELNPLLVLLSRWLSGPRAKVVLANFWHAALPDDTTLIYVFGAPHYSRRLLRRLQKEVTRRGRPLRVLCYGSPLPGTTPDSTFEAYFMYTLVPLQGAKA